MTDTEVTPSTERPPLAFDPSKNVLDLVNFERNHRDSLREADQRYQDLEIKRLDDLAKQKEAFDLRQSEILRVQVSTNASLFSAQSDRNTLILSERITVLERARYENAGKSVGIGLMITGMVTVAGLAVAVTTLVIKLTGG